MLHWEIRHDNARCPHCGSNNTVLLLEFLAVFRYSCGSCAKTFGQRLKREPRDASSKLDGHD